MLWIKRADRLSPAAPTTPATIKPIVRRASRPTCTVGWLIEAYTGSGGDVMAR